MQFIMLAVKGAWPGMADITDAFKVMTLNLKSSGLSTVPYAFSALRNTLFNCVTLCTENTKLTESDCLLGIA